MFFVVDAVQIVLCHLILAGHTVAARVNRGRRMTVLRLPFQEVVMDDDMVERRERSGLEVVCDPVAGGRSVGFGRLRAPVVDHIVDHAGRLTADRRIAVAVGSKQISMDRQALDGRGAAARRKRVFGDTLPPRLQARAMRVQTLGDQAMLHGDVPNHRIVGPCIRIIGQVTEHSDVLV